MFRSNLISWIEGQSLKIGASFNPIRSLILGGMEKLIQKIIVEENPNGFPHKVQEDKYATLIAMLNSANIAFERGIIGSAAKDIIMDILLVNGFLKKNPRYEEFHQMHTVYSHQLSLRSVRQ